MPNLQDVPRPEQLNEWIRAALQREVERIIQEEKSAACDRIVERIDKEKHRMITTMVDRLRVIQREGPPDFRVELIFTTS